jgi:hypothetical protein
VKIVKKSFGLIVHKNPTFMAISLAVGGQMKKKDR